MAKQPGQETGFFGAMFQFGLYKPNQGKIVRQLTFLSLALICCLIAYELFQSGWFDRLFSGANYVTLVSLAAIGIWFSYRVVNWPKFADFLIAVEAEMNKVSWPSRQELWRSSVVVIFVIFFLAGILFLFDAIWSALFSILRIRG